MLLGDAGLETKVETAKPLPFLSDLLIGVPSRLRTQVGRPRTALTAPPVPSPNVDLDGRDRPKSGALAHPTGVP